MKNKKDVWCAASRFEDLALWDPDEKRGAFEIWIYWRLVRKNAAFLEKTDDLYYWLRRIKNFSRKKAFDMQYGDFCYWQ